MLKKLTPNLMVEHVEQTLPEAAPFDFAIVQRDGVELMFQSRASLSDVDGASQR